MCWLAFPIAASRAADALAFYPCLTQAEFAFLLDGLGYRERLSGDPESYGERLSVAVEDLDGDQVPEVFVRLGSLVECQDKSCPVAVYSFSTARGWRKLVEADLHEIAIGKQRGADRYRDLLFDGHEQWRYLADTYRPLR